MAKKVTGGNSSTKSKEESATDTATATVEEPVESGVEPEQVMQDEPETADADASKAKKTAENVRSAKGKKPTRKCFACQKKVGSMYFVMQEVRMRLCLDCGLEAIDQIEANAAVEDYE